MHTLGSYAPATTSLASIRLALSRAEADFLTTEAAVNQAQDAWNQAGGMEVLLPGNAVAKLLYRQRLQEQHRMANIVMALDGMCRHAQRDERTV